MSETIEARIEKLVFGGDGLARVEGQAVFVPFTAPGDLVRARVVERKKGFLRAEVVEVLEPGPGRRDAPCPYFGPCGGCQLQHVDYSTQLEAKASFVREALTRLGRLEPPAELPVHAAPDRELGYRIRATAHVERSHGRVAFGYFGARSRRVVDIESCPLLVPELDVAWRAVREQRAQLLRARDVELAAGDGRAAASPPVAPVGGLGLEASVGGVRYAFSADVFFQANRPLLGDLVGFAVGAAGTGALAVDLYAGVGLFTVPLARGFERVVAVEADAGSAAYARENATANGATAVEVAVEPVEAWLERGALEAGSVDAVLLDPPRAGAGAEAARRIAALGPRRVVYVSCDPSTLARDLRALVDAGYRLASVDVFDLFPQTYHVETVAVLDREE